jgi:hypothetical protein
MERTSSRATSLKEMDINELVLGIHPVIFITVELQYYSPLGQGEA